MKSVRKGYLFSLLFIFSLCLIVSFGIVSSNTYIKASEDRIKEEMKEDEDIQEEADNNDEKTELSPQTEEIQKTKSKIDKKASKDKKVLKEKKASKKKGVSEKKKATEKNKSSKKEAGKKKKNSKKFNGKKVYLTFDDGPSENTDEVLKILDKYDVKGTFFVIGREDKQSKKRYKTIVEKGHTIGLHSYTHNYRQIYANLNAFKKDYKRIDDLVYKVTGVRTHYYRFPGGTSNTVSPISMKVFVDYFNKKGIRYYDWNVQCGDAVKIPPTPYTLYSNVVNSIAYSKQNSFIVLIHDSKPMKNSVKALPLILDWLKKNKYEILPIDDDTVPVHHNVAK